MKINKTQVILLSNYIIGVYILSVAQFVFPEKYFADAETIKISIPTATFQFDFLDSFNNTAFIYKLLGLGTVMPDWLAGFISYSIPFIFIIFICRQQKWGFNTITATVFFLWNVLLALYLGVFSKELLAFVIIALIVLLSKKKSGLFISLIFAAIYGAFFRIYWLPVIGFFLVNLWLIRHQKSLMTIVVIQLILGIAVFQLANMVTGQYLSDARLNVNVDREDALDAVTMINNIFSNTSAITDWLNGVFVWASLLFPFFLLKTGEIQHLLFFVFQISNVILFISVAKYLLKRFKKVVTSIGPGIKLQIEVALAWCIAYSFVQGIFEPDFGSFAKHQVILVPMWFTLLNLYFKMPKNSFQSSILPNVISGSSGSPGSIGT